MIVGRVFLCDDARRPLRPLVVGLDHLRPSSGGGQIGGHAHLLVPPEGLAEPATVAGVPQHRRAQAPGLSLQQAVRQAPEIAQFRRVLGDRAQARKFGADILDRTIVGRGHQHLEALEARVQSIEMQPASAGFQALACGVEGRFRIGESHHRLGALGHQGGHQIAQQSGLSRAWRSVDRQNAAGLAFGQGQIDRRLLQQDQGMTPPARPAGGRIPGRIQCVGQGGAVGEEIRTSRRLDLAQIARQHPGRLLGGEQSPRSRQVVEIEAVEQQGIGRLGAPKADEAANGETRRRDQISREAKFRDQPAIGRIDHRAGQRQRQAVVALDPYPLHQSLVQLAFGVRPAGQPIKTSRQRHRHAPPETGDQGRVIVDRATVLVEDQHRQNRFPAGAGPLGAPVVIDGQQLPDRLGQVDRAQDHLIVETRTGLGLAPALPRQRAVELDDGRSVASGQVLRPPKTRWRQHLQRRPGRQYAVRRVGHGRIGLGLRRGSDGFKPDGGGG